jgi:hypothetical protein
MITCEGAGGNIRVASESVPKRVGRASNRRSINQNIYLTDQGETTQSPKIALWFMNVIFVRPESEM